MDISLRTNQLSRLFSLEKRVILEDSNLEILPFRFTQTEGASEINEFQQELTPTSFCPVADNQIRENQTFSYTVFTPSGKKKHDKAIILLHGLNERTWEKYLTWAEYLTKSTGKPVVLFPIAFHMNRTPSLWSNPRQILPWVNRRKEEIGDICNLTFANVAISSRLSSKPLRFYASGRESAFNLCQLVNEIKQGEHPLFREDASVNLFAYSIGAFLSQVLLLANPQKLFADTRLFMFCGGSVFNHMNGNARDIMDQESFGRLLKYFENEFLKKPSELPTCFKRDYLEKAFRSMVRPEEKQVYRESFFLSACDRIRAISLKKDVVIPTNGIIKALGKASGKILKELDFPFTYSHQRPFPTQNKIDQTLVNESFHQVFDEAASFL